MMQIIGDDNTVANADTHDNYVTCRGFDPESQKFLESVNVGKPYGLRGTYPYQLAEVYPAMKARTRIGDTPGMAEYTTGHPADLDETVEILRDDDGNPIEWLLLDSGGTGGTAPIIQFRVLSASPWELGDEPECENAIRINGSVIEIICGEAEVDIGDRLQIWDPRHCYFDVPMDVLTGAIGTAVKMANTFESDYGTITEYCAEYDELLEEGNCRWVVVGGLTCCEEIYGCD
jgi:hypothetical protein